MVGLGLAVLILFAIVYRLRTRQSPKRDSRNDSRGSGRRIEHHRLRATDKKDMDNGRQRPVVFHVVTVRGRGHALVLLRFGNRSDRIELGECSFYRVCRNLPALEI